MSLRVQLRICDICHQAAQIVNGVHQTALEFTNIDETAVVVPHAPDCEKVIG